MTLARNVYFEKTMAVCRSGSPGVSVTVEPDVQAIQSSGKPAVREEPMPIKS